MKRLYLLVVISALILSSMTQPLWADDGQKIVITGSRISMRDLYDMPAVTVKTPADQLTQLIEIVDDSRNPELRRKEIIQTIGNALKLTQKNKKFSIAYGDGFLTDVKLSDDSLPILNDRKRSDTSRLEVHIKYEFDPQRPAKEQIAELRKFIRQIKTVGRAEIIQHGDVGISIDNPERYRDRILKAILSESERVKSLAGGRCEVLIAGLERRVDWARTGVAELLLYIGYSTELKCK